jgi:DNA mismatch repair protein MutS
LIEKLSKELSDEPPVAVNKGRVFREGINSELDELRSLSTSGKDYLLALQQREAAITGITSLKVAFNNVFGYYIEVSNAHKNKVPQEWIRKQTLVNAERYITEELKEYELKILGAEEKILALETAMYQKLVEAILEYIPALQINAYNIAKLDVLLAFSETAKENNYTKPEVNDGNALKIIKGRHPVIEKCLADGEQYISNDVYLDDKEQQIMIITGPNMSGKSALLRQTALIVLMAQCGSFVPAEEAVLGIVDKVFTRVGASDNLSSGESTFMVEMNETASILNNLSNKSLVLLDEIGRGTSTYDGISIAWAIAEYLHENGKFRPKTLFATHYHELNEMEKYLKRIQNFRVSVKEAGDKIIFMRKLEKGGREHSFGIHVAELAGVPRTVVNRAKEILKQLENKHQDTGKSKAKIAKENYQLSFFQIDDPRLLKIKEDLETTDINRLTPVEALMKLNEMKRILDIG